METSTKASTFKAKFIQNIVIFQTQYSFRVQKYGDEAGQVARSQDSH